MACERALGPEPEAEFGHFFLSLNRVPVSSCYCSLILEESSIGKSFFSKISINHCIIIIIIKIWGRERKIDARKKVLEPVSQT